VSEWKKRKLDTLVTSCLGKMLDAEKNRGEYKPYLANVNVRWGDFDLSNLSKMKFEESESERYGIRKGDLIICEGGEPGRCAIWDERTPDMMIQKALHRVRAKSGLDIRFLYYWFLLASKTHQLDRHFTGSTIKHLPGDVLSEIEIDIPSELLQSAISDVLSVFDRKIALNNRINTELEKTAKFLYDYWFGQFDFPNADGKPYRASGGEMVYNEQLKREIPVGWRVQKLSKTSLCTIMSSGIDMFAGKKIYLSTSEVDGSEIVNHTVRTGYANRLSRANMQPRINSVWFAKMKDTKKTSWLMMGQKPSCQITFFQLVLLGCNAVKVPFIMYGIICAATTLKTRKTLSQLERHNKR
jgi:hypothetical protein